MTTEPSQNRHRLLLVLASASVTMAVAVTAGTLAGYVHPPRPPGPPVSAAVAGPPSRTVLVPIRAIESTAAQAEPVRALERRVRRERDDDGRRRQRGHRDDD